MPKLTYLMPVVVAALTPVLIANAMRPVGSAKAGEALFKQKCMMCHTVTPGAKGITAPNLRGLGGTVSGVGDYRFTPALKNAKILWNAKTLDRFLSAPSAEVPGTMMVTAVGAPRERADIVAYLMTLK